ncbi:tetratricopeptide repeat protein [Pararhizobium sp. LjRoot238]|uniref:tetratricopeptide repeat protein n=1 Tax=Pararhizobium sp. LjRoot238 TaxID=3342293 RepID=UPI003ED159E7
MSKASRKRKAIAQPRPQPVGVPRRFAQGRAIRATVAIASTILVGAAVAFWLVNSGISASSIVRVSGGPPAAAAFVGSETCSGCHDTEANLWRGSQHKHAMDHATEQSVLGDFSDARFDYYGVQSRFFRKDGKFLVETDGPDGKPANFEIKYTFGVDPMQQYLIAFPDGRLQALPIAWDSRPKDEGGQRWFHLYPDEPIPHDDILHWTNLNQNWNYMCAECHSTGVRKNYDAANDRFATTWAEISVGCETCHGEGSRHVAWAQSRRGWWPFGSDDEPEKGLAVRFDERAGVSWTPDAATGMPKRSLQPPLLRKEVETCGLCHARRGQLSEDWVPGPSLSNTHRVSPLDRRLFHADGQMRDVEETYNYAPFKQSKMFAMGVTCSDCHDPHSAALRAPGDGVCAQCHAPDTYQTVAHSRHSDAQPPLACASCHMPARTYMGIDRRHDHSFRIPRPDLTVKLGTPNACNDCHKDKPAEWAATAVKKWFGPDRKGFQTYAEAFHAAGTGQPDADRLLAAVASDANAPAFARASALAELRAYVSGLNVDLARSGLADRDPMVRIGALDMLEGVPADRLWPMVSPLLSDPVRGVRLRAVSLLATVPAARQPSADRGRFDQAAEEFIAAQRVNADRPEGRTALGTFFAQHGMAAEAEAEYRAALRLSSGFAPAAVNLADLYRQLGRDADGEPVLRAALTASPKDSGIHHALGLTLVRLKQFDKALEELRQAAEFAPDQARYAYAYAIALHSAGRAGDAIAVLKANLVHHPRDRDTLLALTMLSRDGGDLAAALDYAERLLRLAPDDHDLFRFIRELRRLTNSGQ